MKYLIDTSVLSQPPKPTPDPSALRWIQQQPVQEGAISAISIFEIRSGIEQAPLGAKRREIEQWLEDFVLPTYAGRILPVNEAVADTCGRIFAAAKSAGQTPEMGDALIAATAKVHGLQIVTLNRKHFKHLGVPLVAL